MPSETASAWPARKPVAGVRRRLALLLCAALSLGLAAADARGERLYQVELVVFSQPAGTSVELPPRTRAPADVPAAALGGEEGAGAEENPAHDPGAAAGGTPWTLPAGFSAPRDPLRLNNVATRLNTRGYRLLWHQAWVQPPIVARQAVDLDVLAGLGRGPATQGLSGAVTLSLRRFLHLGVALELRSGGQLDAELQQQRRIRLGADQYFDHPRIGVIAVVHPVGADSGQPSSPP
jgi:hypothetical protein